MRLSLREYTGPVATVSTSLNTITINRRDLYKLYPQIGFGDEGSIHKYNDSKAFKTFAFSKEQVLEDKFNKIELLGQEKDESFEFPQELVLFEDGQKAAYMMNLVEENERAKSFEWLHFLKDQAKIIQCLLKADAAVRRIHNKNIIIGDVRGANIMIDNDWNPRFVDTDNYAIGPYNFDLTPGVTCIYGRIFGKECSMIDNDKFTFALMALQCFISGTLLNMASKPRYYQELIKYLDVSQYAKEILELIFSDADNKPYIGEALKEFDPEKKLLKNEYIYSLNRIF